MRWYRSIEDEAYSLAILAEMAKAENAMSQESIRGRGEQDLTCNVGYKAGRRRTKWRRLVRNEGPRANKLNGNGTRVVSNAYMMPRFVWFDI